MNKKLYRAKPKKVVPIEVERAATRAAESIILDMFRRFDIEDDNGLLSKAYLTGLYTTLILQEIEK